MKENLPDNLIRDYLSGKLTPEGRENFEIQLASDPHLAQELAHRRIEMAAAEVIIADETRRLYAEWKSNRRSIFGKRWINLLLIAGAGLTLVTAGIQLFYKKPAKQAPKTEMPEMPAPKPEAAQPIAGTTPEKSPSHPKPTPNYLAMARQQLTNPVLSNLRRGASDSTAGTFVRAQLAFESGNYRQTLELLQQTDSSRLQSATYLTAHALFRLNRYREAGQQFEKLVQMNSLQYRYPGEWGLLMCRLAAYPSEKKEFLEQLYHIVSRPDHPYYEQARHLQKTMKLWFNLHTPTEN